MDLLCVTNILNFLPDVRKLLSNRLSSVSNYLTWTNSNGRKRRHLPQGSGKYSVGLADVMFGNPSKDPFIRLFYPTEVTDVMSRKEQWPLWLPRKQYCYGYVYFRRYMKILGNLLNWVGGDVYVPALWQAPPFKEKKLPVIVFSHGLGGNRTTYTTICTDFASCGYLVAAIEHKDGSASMTCCFKSPFHSESIETLDLSDLQFLKSHNALQEKWILYERQKDELNYDLRNPQVHTRADECSRVLDVLTRINNGECEKNYFGTFNMGQFKGLLDLDRVSVVGHSFGGATVVSALAKDKRFKAGVGLDSWMAPLDDNLYSQVTQPLLLVNTETFQWPENVKSMYKLIDPKKTDDLKRILITIKGTCHQTQSDFQFVIPTKLARLLDFCHTLDPQIAMSLNNRATRGFLALHTGLPHDTHLDVLMGNHDKVILGTNLDISA